MFRFLIAFGAVCLFSVASAGVAEAGGGGGGGAGVAAKAEVRMVRLRLRTLTPLMVLLFSSGSKKLTSQPLLRNSMRNSIELK